MFCPFDYLSLRSSCPLQLLFFSERIERYLYLPIPPLKQFGIVLFYKLDMYNMFQEIITCGSIATIFSGNNGFYHIIRLFVKCRLLKKFFIFFSCEGLKNLSYYIYAPRTHAKQNFLTTQSFIDHLAINCYRLVCFCRDILFQKK